MLTHYIYTHLYMHTHIYTYVYIKLSLYIVSHLYIICHTHIYKYVRWFIKHYSLLSILLMLIYTFQRTILNPYLLWLLNETWKACQTTIIHYLKFIPGLPPWEHRLNHQLTLPFLGNCLELKYGNGRKLAENWITKNNWFSFQKSKLQLLTYL